MRHATLIAVGLALLAVFCAADSAEARLLRWNVTVGATSGAMAEATIVTGSEPWAMTLSEVQSISSTPSVFWLGSHGLDVHWNGLDCILNELEVSVEWAGLAEIRGVAGALSKWPQAATAILILSEAVFLAEAWTLTRRDHQRGWAAIGLGLLGFLALVTVLALLHPFVIYDYFGWLNEEPGCTGGVTLLAQFVGIQVAGAVWLAASVICGVGAMAAVGWRTWPVIRARVRRAADQA